MNWSGVRVLVTGASGFIGSALAIQLNRLGAHVTSLTNQVEYPMADNVVIGDLRDYGDVEKAVVRAEPDVLFHMAAVTQVTEASKMNVQTYDVNAMGTLRLLDVCHRVFPRQIQIIVASTDKVYGYQPMHIPYPTTLALRPMHPYEVSKASADWIAQSFARYYEEKIQITRLANVYGPGDKSWKRLIPGLIRWLLTEQAPIIRSSGKHERQYLYIDDAVEAYLKIAEWALNKMDSTLIWNVGPESSATYSVNDILERLRTLVSQQYSHLDLKDPIYEGGAEDEAKHLAIDSWLTHEALNWTPKIDLETGLKRSLEWYSQYIYSFRHSYRLIDSDADRFEEDDECDGCDS